MLTTPTQQRSIVLGITGGIAAYKAAELVRLLVKQQYEVQVVMTEAACQFITPATLQALSGKPVYTNLWDNSIANGMPHIELSRNAQAIVIAPASADFLAKIAHGFANDLLSTLCLARDCQLIVAPAMNKQMWENPATQRNMTQLCKDGLTILGPDAGEQACGEIGLGRMLEPEDIMAGIEAHFTPKLMHGKSIMITAGATLEMIDPVRAITNLSSGKMGYALAQVAANMGAQVTLVSGVSGLNPPTNVHTIQALSAENMHQTVMQHISSQDIFIGVAAVADYSPTEIASQKIKKSEESLTLHLKRNKDILADVANLPNAPYCVGFAAETENILEYARKKRIAKRLPMIIANQATHAMGSDTNQVTIIDDQGEYPLAQASKLDIATKILTHLSQNLGHYA
uniref:phosphopantothenoylcysteine decarboxylase n=1 Tax=Nymphaea colorata TaxID=210225 RepID=A0A5K1HNL6_9MAGN|nr:unnamed protein product [Nymphaea colorata]